MRPTRFVVALLFLLAGCTIVRVDSQNHPPGIRSSGVVDGHLTFGFSDEDALLRAELFDGRSPGAFFELGVWKLFRVELGLAGAAVGVGPVDMGFGVGFYEPRVPTSRQQTETMTIDVYEDPGTVEQAEQTNKSQSKAVEKR